MYWLGTTIQSHDANIVRGRVLLDCGPRFSSRFSADPKRAGMKVIEDSRQAGHVIGVPVSQHGVIELANAAAVRESLQLCRERGVPARAVRMPEGSAFRGMYPKEARRLVARYVAELERDFGPVVIDARGWLDDAEFGDSHHPLSCGATAYSRRLAAELPRHLTEDVARRSAAGIEPPRSGGLR